MSLESPPARHAVPPATPGRSCPLHYRYSPADLARESDLRAETLYLIGGLYGNRPALDAVFDLAAHDTGPVTLVFNGDFNWFNVDDAAFTAVNHAVLEHRAIRGNVETEIAGDDETAGCGCAYPDWVSDAEVGRSNSIIKRLRATAQRHPELRGRLAMLPMQLVVDVAGVRVAVVHGDAESLAGWSFSQEALADREAAARLGAHFEAANARVFASSHTCLPLITDCRPQQGRCVLINNGAAGMPNFEQTTFGVITRIASTGAPSPVEPLYRTRLDSLSIEALPVRYDASRWLQEYNANWPPGTAAHDSYSQRIMHGPRYTLRQAVRLHVSP